MPPPPLTRQNAFYCERSQDKTPLDPHCSICHRELYALCKFIRPCRCEPEDTIPLYAHQECFVNWFILHGCPRQCPACKSNYHIPYSFYLAVSVLKKNRYQLIFIALLILSIFIFTHVARCTNFQILTKQEFINQFGEEQYRNVPERLIMPVVE